jgi:hypothetical protein
MHDDDPMAEDVLARALGVERSIEEAWRWAIEPVVEARVLGPELAELAVRRSLPLGGLRALTQLALGEPARPAVVDRWLEGDAEVVALLGRVGAVSRRLEGLASRTRVATRNAMGLALAAPRLARLAAAAVWQRGPAPDRDAVLRALEGMPLAAKRRADEIRAEAVLAGPWAQRAREGILAALRLQARTALVRTDRLVPV